MCCWLCFTLRYSRFSSCTPERWKHQKPTRPANTTAASYSYNHRRVQKETAGFAVLVVPDLEIGVSTFWPFVHKEQPPERPQRITTHRNCCWSGFIRVVVVAVVVPVFVDLIQPRHTFRTPPCCCPFAPCRDRRRLAPIHGARPRPSDRPAMPSSPGARTRCPV